MSRKRANMFDHVIPAPTSAEDESQAGKPTIQRAGPIVAMDRILDRSAEETRRLQESRQLLETEVEDLKKQLRDGVNLQEVDPALIDPSPIRDRLDDTESSENESLRASIAESGQRVPALLRPNPKVPGRYLTVFGHRRVAAVKALGLRLKAIVTEISDEDAFVAQGQENNERKNTSFIERCLFARRLKDRGLRGEKLIAAISGGKPNVYKMIEIAETVPEDIIVAIGPAPAIGRPRWLELAAAFPQIEESGRKIASSPEFHNLASDDRFHAILKLASTARTNRSSADDFLPLADREGELFAFIKRHSGGEATLKLSKSDGARRPDGLSFSDWLETKLPSFRQEWLDGR